MMTDNHADSPFGEDPIELELTDSLDLHGFRPKDIGSLIPEYLRCCVEAGFPSVRIIHGKGIGSLRQGVHVILDRSPLVSSYRLGRGGEGSWGSTVAFLQSETDERP